MSYEAWGDDDSDRPYTQERVDEIVSESIEEIAEKLFAMGTGMEPVPPALTDVPYVAMQKISVWITENA